MSAAERPEPKTPASRGGADRDQSLAGDLAVVLRRWRLVVGVVLATLIVFGALHDRKAKSYAATASVTFTSNTLSGAALNIATAGSSEPQREADTEVLIAHSAEVAEAVRHALKLKGTPTELLSEVKVEAAPTANVLNLIATTGDPQQAAVLANAFATQYIAFRAQAQLNGIATAQAKIQEQIASLPATSPERPTLEQTLVRLDSSRAIAGGGANVIGRATAPTSPTGSGLATTIMIGLLVGLAIALALVFLLEYLDRRVKTIDEFERGYGLQALVGIPQSSSRTAQPENDQLEPYRILRSALDFTAVTRQLDTLMVTSAVSGEGKTTVAVNLARVIALSGRRTVLVELDLRRPVTVGPFDLAAERGVTTVITGAAELDELLQQPLAELPNLLMLPSGALPHNPSELLGSQRITDLLSELATGGTMVIVDVAPLNPVADAQVLLNNPMIHATLLVARIERTTRDEMHLARSILDHHKTEPVGIVVTDVRETGRYGYGSYAAAGPTFDVGIEASAAGRTSQVPDKTRQARVVNLDPSTTAPAGSRRSRSSRRQTSK